MINKRGLTPKEFDELPDGLFDMLLVFDRLIEPSGVDIDMMYHSHALYNNFISSGNATKETRDKIKPNDFDFLDVIGKTHMTTKEKQKEREEKESRIAENNIAAFGEMIKQQALGANKNG